VPVAGGEAATRWGRTQTSGTEPPATGYPQICIRKPVGRPGFGPANTKKGTVALTQRSPAISRNRGPTLEPSAVSRLHKYPVRRSLLCRRSQSGGDGREFRNFV